LARANFSCSSAMAVAFSSFFILLPSCLVNRYSFFVKRRRRIILSSWG
jgi:hypothetical protein